MTHLRQQLRSAAVTALTGLDATGSRVFSTRIRQLSPDELPCLIVNTNDEGVSKTSITDRIHERSLMLTVQAIARASDDLDDALDALVADVEAVLDGKTLGGLARSVLLDGIKVELNDDLERPVGIASVAFKVTYYTAPGAPENPRFTF